MIHVQDKILPVKRLAGKEVSKDYPGVDNWKNVVLEKGTILFTLYPHGPAGMASALGIILFEDTLYVLQEEMPEHLTILYR